MGKVKIVLNREGVRSLLKSQEMQDICKEHATSIRSRCGSGYETDVYVGQNRANAMVWTDTLEAIKDNLQNNTILKAMK